MAGNTLQPPHWLNPDAILGAVEYMGVRYFATTIHIGVRKGNATMSLVDPRFKAPASTRKFASKCTLRPDLWPVKPELAALFGEGTE